MFCSIKTAAVAVVAARCNRWIHQCSGWQHLSDRCTQQWTAMCHGIDWCLWPSHRPSTVWMR